MPARGVGDGGRVHDAVVVAGEDGGDAAGGGQVQDAGHRLAHLTDGAAGGIPSYMFESNH